MAEYIKRMSAMTVCEKYGQHCFEQNDNHGQHIADCIFDDITNIPSADVVKVRHAYWKTREEHNDYLWVECSNCGFMVENYKAVKTGNSSTDIIGNKWNGCPICLAKMDGKNYEK